MKLIIAIVRDHDYDGISHALTGADLRVTSIASTGGFLRRGYTTLLIGLEDEQVTGAIDLIKQNCSAPTAPDSKRATIFVLNVNQYIHF